MLMDRIDDTGFAGRYNWVAFRAGKSSQKQQIYSRAYINFKRPEDVIEFAELFDGHVFVNEKGSQFKTIVEYAPSQHVPKLTSKKDGREGTLLKDPEYLEFMEILAKPVENLPSAEIQLEKREAERSGAAKGNPIITPLMDFVRQKRASKAASRRSLSNEKPSGRAGTSRGSAGSGLSKRSSEKRKNSTTMYVMRNSARSGGGKDRSTGTLASRRDDQHLSDKSVSSPGGATVGQAEEDSGASGKAVSAKKKILLVKGKEREIYNLANNASEEHLPAKDSAGSIAVKHNQRREGSGRIIRSILLNKDARQNPSGVHSENQTQTSHNGREKRPPRVPNSQPVSKDANGAIDEKSHGNGLPSFGGEKAERRLRNKERPDRGVWAPLRRIDGSQGSEYSSSTSSQLSADYSEGSHKSLGRRGQSLVGKDNDGSLLASEFKSSKRGSAPGCSSHEKQVWIQKSTAGT
ncbi:hypothetical protein MLD38_023147 [Melastoma candidum]|uniref:Uncharacterized protein n=1 Tax=Melastoma candidum TaxID=119954 RepID=A0ACB9QND7_9MYRT|nr:hypothetical protein MLD38_023147 [Melastoma candidum]